MFTKKYINKTRNIAADNNILKIVLTALVIIIAIEGYFIVKAFNMQKVIIIPTVTTKYAISSNTANKQYLESMSSYLTGLVLNFTPLTIKRNYNRFLDYVAPTSFFGIQSGLYANINPYMQSDASSWFIIKNTTVYPNKIVVTGIQRLLMSNKIVNNKGLKITLGYAIVNGEFQITDYSQVKDNKF